MSDIIVDTSALIAFFVRSELHHASATQYVRQNPTQRWVILSTVFDEFVTWMRAKVSIASSIQVGALLRQEHIYINISDVDDDAAWGIFRQYDDKHWSYTDCSILAVAQKLGIFEIFAFDEHIRQMQGLGVISVPLLDQ